jgi:hypothetical protein
MFDGSIMNFGSHRFELLYGSRLYFMCVETSSYVSNYRRRDVWNVGVVNVQRFVVCICAAENSLNGWILFSFTHKVSTIAIQWHTQMWPDRDRVGSTPFLYSGGFRLEYRHTGYYDWGFQWFFSVSSEIYQLLHWPPSFLYTYFRTVYILLFMYGIGNYWQRH